MARRKSNAETLVELIALLPWWVSVALAGVSFVGLSALAAEPLGRQGGGVPAFNVVAVLAGAFRWILPLLFLVGAVGSVLARARRANLLSSARSDGAAAVSGMTWREFEMLVGEAFRRKGYVVAETGGRGADGGVDLVLRRNSDVALVQCKHWKTWRVGLPVVREFLGAMTAKQASKGWVITSGRFTAEAIAFAGQHGIELVDGDAMSSFVGSSTNPREAPVPPADTTAREVPSCPQCGSAMLLRTARRGSKVGQSFWGCTRFPDCRGTKAVGEGG
jgi:restriction system protein